MNQLLEILCQLSDGKVFSYTFNTLHPEISQPLYYFAYFLIFIALGIISFTQVVSNLE